MGKSTNQKLKILYILQMLMDCTDEEHPLSATDIITRLKNQGIQAERKSIYDDIENLQRFGIDIISRRSEPKGYYIGSRDFELPELKVLVDAVQVSKFITEKKSHMLIKKIEKLAGAHAAKELQNQVVVSNRIKTTNERIYYNVDKIHSAISANVRISFKYCEWTIQKKLVPKKNGELYHVSPWVLTWDDENYYLIAHDAQSGQIRHYRVDKMMDITLISGSGRKGRELFEQFDIASYSKRTFGMFAGEEKTLTIIFSNSLIGVVLDRFGREANIVPHDSESFRLMVNVNVSAQFYGWLSALEGKAVIAEPKEEAEKYLSFMKKIIGRYEV